ncbi:hypothetical protein CYLTODRAFT_459405 [Cylindrobasidium torrendii FP15055 ss-10]|uniref:Uncharacterized protein n=1 Tax=Cylindrobasidium torrendii FP15055 ss-10 TaxID=1314674 RepID=A0A0D7AUS9_9AGAR|nr:hypothetical protein CYLTODRAFT_459405 [Cylindrobasidium torrendii FP15055 ss-10]
MSWAPPHSTKGTIPRRPTPSSSSRSSIAKNAEPVDVSALRNELSQREDELVWLPFDCAARSDPQMQRKLREEFGALEAETKRAHEELSLAREDRDRVENENKTISVKAARDLSASFQMLEEVRQERDSLLNDLNSSRSFMTVLAGKHDAAQSKAYLDLVAQSNALVEANEIHAHETNSLTQRIIEKDAVLASIRREYRDYKLSTEALLSDYQVNKAQLTEVLEDARADMDRLRRNHSQTLRAMEKTARTQDQRCEELQGDIDRLNQSDLELQAEISHLRAELQNTRKSYHEESTSLKREHHLNQDQLRQSLEMRIQHLRVEMETNSAAHQLESNRLRAEAARELEEMASSLEDSRLALQDNIDIMRHNTREKRSITGGLDLDSSDDDGNLRPVDKCEKSIQCESFEARWCSGCDLEQQLVMQEAQLKRQDSTIRELASGVDAIYSAWEENVGSSCDM